MHWKKLGLIFNVNGKQDWMQTHAAVPFAYSLGQNHFRIFFSSRDRLGRSQPGYFDLDIENPHSISNISEDPILKIGEPGRFDDSGVMLSWITQVNRKNYLYYIGWNVGNTVPYRNSVGLATQTEDLPFEKYSLGPVLDRSIYDPCFTSTPCVLLDQKTWKMWYLSCFKWKRINDKYEPIYDIKYAESKDGIHWNSTGAICIGLQSEEEYAIARPSVIQEDGIYKMWYSYRGTQSYRMGYAESTDGIRWNRKDSLVGIDVSKSGWDAEMIAYPHVFDHHGRRYMVYNGNGFGKSGIGLAVLE
jgi:hypothetical protein